ncbi:MAG TPA: redoxin domain-containing protein [Tepidisphaeraceae bacterium]|jgi:peroxiredoxin|nr:redoxin domain-containing protein [Tepidisphaeraceae bacterium]
MKTKLLAALIVLGLNLMAAAANPPMLKIGEKAPDFSLPGVDGRTYSLKDFADGKILVIIFTCNHCPTAQAYEQRIIKLHEDYRDKGVALVAISPNDPAAVRLDELGYTEFGDSFEEMKVRAKERGLKFPYLYDGETQAAAKAYGVVATPHVYIFDQERVLKYVGRIDDSEVKTVTSQDARNAIEAMLAGKAAPVEVTKVFGCSTKWADKSDSAKKSLAKWEAEAVKISAIDAEGVRALAKNDSKKLLLINVWATWCGPCVNELPELVTMNRMYRKRPFELITISMDDPKKQEQALEMLNKLHVSATNYIFSSDKRDALVEALDAKWPGPVPHTILVAPGGKVIYRQTGEFDAMELKKAIVGYLGRTY